MSGRGYFPEFWRVSDDRVQSLHWMWQMCEEMPYESNETSRREQTIKRFESETSAWLIMPKISDRFGQWLWRFPYQVYIVATLCTISYKILFAQMPLLYRQLRKMYYGRCVLKTRAIFYDTFIAYAWNERILLLIYSWL